MLWIVYKNLKKHLLSLEMQKIWTVIYRNKYNKEKSPVLALSPATEIDTIFRIKLVTSTYFRISQRYIIIQICFCEYSTINRLLNFFSHTLTLIITGHKPFYIEKSGIFLPKRWGMMKQLIRYTFYSPPSTLNIGIQLNDTLSLQRISHNKYTIREHTFLPHSKHTGMLLEWADSPAMIHPRTRSVFLHRFIPRIRLSCIPDAASA